MWDQANFLDNEENINMFQEQEMASIWGIFFFFSKWKQEILFLQHRIQKSCTVPRYLWEEVLGVSTSLHVASRVSMYVTKLLMLSCEPGRAKGSEFKFLYPSFSGQNYFWIWSGKANKNDHSEQYLRSHADVTSKSRVFCNSGEGELGQGRMDTPR